MKQMLRNLVADGKTAKAIAELRLLTASDAHLSRDVNLLAARFAKYELQHLGNLEDPSVLSIELNKINNALLSVIDNLENVGEVRNLPDVKTAITNKNVVGNSTINASGNVTIGDTTTVTESTTSRNLRLFLYIFVPILALAAALGYTQYQKLNEPLSLTVFLKDAMPNPAVPLKLANVTLTYGDKKETKVVENEAIFKGIPPSFKDQSILVEVHADGFTSVIQFFVFSKNVLTIPLSKDGSLSKVLGIIKDENRNPVMGAQVSVLASTAFSDSFGHFVVPIDFEQQRPSQRIQAFKKGFKLWDFDTPIIPNEPVLVILKK